MALWVSLMIVLIVYTFCWSPKTDEEEYQNWKKERDKVEQLQQFEQRYQKEKKGE